MEVIFRSFGELIQRFLTPDPFDRIAPGRPCLTYAQKIAPSSDWFIGFSNVCATDEDGALALRCDERRTWSPTTGHRRG